MHVGAGLWSCGDALSTAEIWSSDSGLVFLLHNQFAVWIPLHITLNMHSSPDPAKSLFFFHPLPISRCPFFSPAHIFVYLTFKPEVVQSQNHLTTLVHEAVQNSLTNLSQTSLP